jgi:hypothetical protein
MSWTLFCMAVPVGAGLVIGALGAWGLLQILEWIGAALVLAVRWIAEKIGRKKKDAAQLAEAAPPIAQTADYIDWSKVPEGYDWVAVDSPEWTGKLCCYLHEPSYDRHCNNMAWLHPLDDQRLEDPWRSLPQSAIIGPLPPWRESLRRRPGSATSPETSTETKEDKE